LNSQRASPNNEQNKPLLLLLLQLLPLLLPLLLLQLLPPLLPLLLLLLLLLCFVIISGRQTFGMSYARWTPDYVHCVMLFLFAEG
jgi:hypothetical protein